MAFLICWFPHMLHTIFTLKGYFEGVENATKTLVLEVVGKATSYAHAIVNPIIYTFASPIFRRSLRSSLREKWRNCTGPTNCAKKNSALIAQRNHNGNNIHRKFSGASPDPEQEIPMISKNGAKTSTNRNEPMHMLVADSHVTEVTRIASPDLSLGRRVTQSSLAAVDETNHFGAEKCTSSKETMELKL